jgi:hypothetical protein
MAHHHLISNRTMRGELPSEPLTTIDHPVVVGGDDELTE